MHGQTYLGSHTWLNSLMSAKVGVVDNRVHVPCSPLLSSQTSPCCPFLLLPCVIVQPTTAVCTDTAYAAQTCKQEAERAAWTCLRRHSSMTKPSQALCWHQPQRKGVHCSKQGWFSFFEGKNNLCHCTCSCLIKLMLPSCEHLLSTLPHPATPNKFTIFSFKIFPHYFHIENIFSASVAVV